MSSGQTSSVVSYKPSVFYFRQAARNLDDPDQLRELVLTLCLELEAQKAWARSKGLRPPRFYSTEAEAADKSWSEVDHAEACPLPPPESA